MADCSLLLSNLIYTPGRKSSISGEVTMKLALLLLLASLTIDSALERSHRNALLTFDEWDLNKDCFVTYEEFINYFLDMIFSIRMFEARASAGSGNNRYLSEESFEMAALNITGNWSLLDSNKADERIVMRHLLHNLRSKLKGMGTSQIKNVFKIRRVINSTFWHRP